MAKKRVYKVKAPKRDQETIVYYYEYAMDFFDKHFDQRPPRQTLYNYMVDGYPVDKRGTRVAMPIYMSMKRPKTSVEAMERFLTQVRHLEAKLKLKPLCAA